MKKVINGKIYNTETAQMVAEFSNGLGHGDFRSLSECLYKTKRGQWFLWGKGGAMSKYSRPVGNMTSGGEGMRLLNASEAMEILTKWNEIDVIETHFGEIEEG